LPLDFIKRLTRALLPTRPTDSDLRETMQRSRSSETEARSRARDPAGEALRAVMLGNTPRATKREGPWGVSHGADGHLRQFSTIGIAYRAADGERTERIITIQQMVEDDHAPSMIYAFCHRRRELRQFRVDRIEGLFDPDSGEVLTEVKLAVHSGPMAAFPSQFVPRDPTREGPNNIAEAFERFTPALIEAGWTPKVQTDENSESLGCHRLGKRGKVLKHPEIVLGFEPFNYDHVVDAEGRDVWVKAAPRARPWTVRAPERSTRSWSHIEPALAAFLEAAGAKPAGD